MTFKIDPNKWHKNGEDIMLNYDDDASLKHSNRAFSLSRLENFGLWMLTIEEAAEVIACDMWSSGEIESRALDDFDGPMDAPEVKVALADVIRTFEARLINAIDAGRLIPCNVIRDFDERIVTSETFVSYQPLEQWVNERGYEFSEAFTDLHEREQAIEERLIDELIWLRSVQGKKRRYGLTVGLTSNPRLLDESNHTDLIDAYKSAILENEHLRAKLIKSESEALASNEPSLSPKSRRTHLLAIAALLELLKAPTDRPRPRGMNQEAIRDSILEKFPLRGLGDRSLQEIFSNANKAKADAE